MYEDTLQTLRNKYPKQINPVFARHQLEIRLQNTDESIHNYLITLTDLACCCDYANVTAIKHKEKYTFDKFICGIQSDYIRQLLEAENLTLSKANELDRSIK
ncbi:hypothetical protein GJ496_011373 [Pomphorhynchus laevis]|nr:hypothetical protein GJ496_011373 [Pomphorhynchus laevis]